MSKFTDGSAAAYAELPVKPAYLRWTRGDAKMRGLVKTDPAQFFGGWRANVVNREGEPNPVLPLPIVERVSEDGKHVFKSYSSNWIEFLPVQHRTRFELREKVKDTATGKESTIIRAIANEKLQGYAPVRQVFGLVYVEDNSAPAVLYIDKWSSFISFERAGQKWSKIQVPDDSALVRRYGSVGIKDKDTGEVMPNFEIYGDSRSTPIEAVGLSKPRIIKVTPDLEQLYEDSLAWRNCPRWNSAGEVNEVIGESDKTKFLVRCVELGLNDVDIAQIVAEHRNNYTAALKSINEGNDIYTSVPEPEFGESPF